MISVWTAVEKPYCIPLGGCIGTDVCAYCGYPIGSPERVPTPTPRPEPGDLPADQEEPS